VLLGTISVSSGRPPRAAGGFLLDGPRRSRPADRRGVAAFAASGSCARGTLARWASWAAAVGRRLCWSLLAPPSHCPASALLPLSRTPAVRPVLKSSLFCFPFLGMGTLFVTSSVLLLQFSQAVLYARSRAVVTGWPRRVFLPVPSTINILRSYRAWASFFRIRTRWPAWRACFCREWEPAATAAS